MVCRPSWSLLYWQLCCSEMVQHSLKPWSWGRWLLFSVFPLEPKLHSCTVEQTNAIQRKYFEQNTFILKALSPRPLALPFLTFSLVAWQLRSVESMKPRPKTRMLRQLKARMSHSPPFSKSVNSTGWPNRGEIIVCSWIHYKPIKRENISYFSSQWPLVDIKFTREMLILFTVNY